MVKTVVKPIFGGSKRCQEIENPTPHKFFSAVIIPYLEGIVKRLLSTCKICGAVVKEKSSADLLAYHAEKSQKNQRDCKVRISRHFVILCKCTISQSETNVTTQNLHRRSQRKRPEKKLNLFSIKHWTFSLFCGMLLC